MPDTNVKLNATIDATSRGLQEALDRATNAVNSTTSKWQSKMKKVDAATDSVAQHVGKLNELLAKAADGVVDTNAIQAEMEALEHAQHELDRASNEMDRLAQTADKAGKAVAQAGKTTEGATDGFDQLAGKVKIANVSLKDLKDVMSSGAAQGVAVGNILTAVFSTISGIMSEAASAAKEMKRGLDEVERMQRRIERMDVAESVGDAEKLSAKMRELYELKDNWTGSEADKAREKLLQEEISWLQRYTAEQDRVVVAINGRTVAQEKLKDAIIATLNAEDELKRNSLAQSISQDTEKLEKMVNKLAKLEKAPDDLKSRLAREIQKIKDGDLEGPDFSLTNLSWRGAKIEQNELRKSIYELSEKLKTDMRTLKGMQPGAAANAFRTMEDARQRDRGRNAAAEAAGANLDADEALKRLNLSPEDRAIADERRKIEAEYNAQLRAGVDAEKAEEIRDRQLDELEKRVEAEKARKEAAYLDELKKRTDAMEQARQRYEAAEKDVERAQKAYADAQDDLAREARAEAMRQRRQGIRDSLAKFGFRIADGFDQYESAVDRHRRVRLVRTDAGIADKMARWQAGEKVHFSVRERDRLAEYQDLQEEDAQLEAAQKQVEAAARQENSAERLSAAADAVKSAASRLDEAREGVKALVAPGVNAANAANYNDKLQQLHTDLQEMARRTFRVI